MEISIGCIIIINRKIGGVLTPIRVRVVDGPIAMANGRTYWYVESLGHDEKKFSISPEDVVQVLPPRKKPDFNTGLGQALGKALEDTNKLKEVIAGCKVTFRFLDEENEKTYELVGFGLTDLSKGKLGIDKPLGCALIGQEVGAVLELNGRQIEIISALKIKTTPPKIDESEKTSPKPLKIKSISEVDLGEKKEFVLRPPKDSGLVLAGPGCGKSFALVNKVAYFVETHNCNPNSILVLSFSREAVAEVKRRLSTFEIRNVEYVHPFTIDSFAASIISRRNPNFLWGEKSYDDAIEEATKLMEVNDFNWIKHLFVDEIQDIVGCRAEFIKRVIELLPTSCGFTMLGDLNQSIYNWSLREQGSQITSDQFMASITGNGTRNLAEFRFEKNWRTSEDIRGKLHSPILSLLTESASSGQDRISSLKADWKRLLSQYDRITTKGMGKYTGTGELSPQLNVQKCVLVRDNGQLIGEKERNVPPGLNLRVLGKYMRGQLPAWVAKLFYDFRSQKILSRSEEFVPFWGRLEDSDGWEEAEGWSLLKEIEQVAHLPNALDLSVLKRRLGAIREVPLSRREKEELSTCPLIISTIHCSKGLEFDHVSILEPDIDSIPDIPSLLEEMRLFYVGVSRAKSVVRLLDDASVHRLRSLRDDNTGNIIRWYGKGRDGKTEFSVDNDDDVDGASFITKFGKQDIDKVQYMLQKHVRSGDEIKIRLESSNGHFVGQRYFIYRENVCYGCMSLNFYRSMEKLFGYNKPLEFSAKVGKLYTEFRFNTNSSESVDPDFTNKIEAWTAMKLTGLCRG